MANYQNLLDSIAAVIRTNGNQEITGAVLQSTLQSMVSVMGANATYGGVAHPTDSPGTPDGPVVYVASEGGIYTNFGAISIDTDELAMLLWNPTTGTWSKESLAYIADKSEMEDLIQQGIEDINDAKDDAITEIGQIVQSVDVTYETISGENVQLKNGDGDLLTPKTKSEVVTYNNIPNVPLLDTDLQTLIDNNLIVEIEMTPTHWESTSGTAIYASNQYNGSCVIHNITKTSNVRIGYTLSVPNDIYIRLQFDNPDRNLNTSGTLSLGSTYTSTWNPIVDVRTGNTKTLDSNNHMDLVFKKTSSINYLLIASNSFPSGTNITLNNVKITALLPTSYYVKWYQATPTPTSWRLMRAKDIKKYVDTSNLSYTQVSGLTWSTNQPTRWTISDTDGMNATLKLVTPASYTYVGVDLSSIPNGSRCRLIIKDVNGIIGHSGFFTMATSISDSTWRAFVDEDGRTVNAVDGVIDMFFIKQYNFLKLPGNQMSSGSIIKFEDSSIRIVNSMSVLAQLNTEVNIIKTNSSSVVPPNYTWTNYMSISASSFNDGNGQGSTVYGNYFIVGFTAKSDNTEGFKIYNLETKQLEQEIIVSGITNTQTHANTLSFGKKYNNSDELPLLYVPSGYSPYHVYVIRFTGAIGAMSASVIQTITIDTTSWFEFVCEGENSDYCWIIVSSGGYNKHCRCALPSTNSPTVTIDPLTECTDSFDMMPIKYPAPTTKSSAQGRFFNQGRIWYVSGVPSYEGEGAGSCFISALNVNSKCREFLLFLKDVGLTSGTSNTYEPESCFIWNNGLYIAYRTFIAKLTKVDLA